MQPKNFKGLQPDFGGNKNLQIRWANGMLPVGKVRELKKTSLW